LSRTNVSYLCLLQSTLTYPPTSKRTYTMDSHGLVLFILTLAILTGVFLFARWLSRFLQKFELPPDTRVLILISFVGVLLVASLNFIWQRSASSPPTPPEQTGKTGEDGQPITELDLDTYESTAFPELHVQRKDMVKQLEDLHNFFAHVRDWADQMPAQRRFLQTIIDIRWKQDQQLRKAYQTIDRSRREFWMHYRTGEDHYVRQMFAEEAVRLQKRIQEALGDSRNAQLDEADAINWHVHQAVELLQTAKLTKPKPGKPYPFQPYSEENRQRLLEMLTRQQENSILTNLSHLYNSETQIRKKIAYIMEYRQINTDLQSEVGDLIITWNDALIYNQYAQYRILFGVEVLELIQQLGVTPASRDYAWLLEKLRELSPKVVAQDEEERKTAAYSYNPDVDHKYRKPR
jgi:hypothetical protein